MKYEQTNTWFIVQGNRVKPLNGETDLDPPQLSWSHGFTHFKTENGKVMHCGTYWFEDNAQEINEESWTCK